MLKSNSQVTDPFQEEQSWYAVIDWELDHPDPLFPLAEDYDNVTVAQNSEHSNLFGGVGSILARPCVPSAK